MQLWIDYYGGEEFQAVVRSGVADLEQYAASDPPSEARLSSLQRIWNVVINRLLVCVLLMQLLMILSMSSRLGDRSLY